jgi:dTDP-4-amino-4,6-dideoxy-D-glucose acyltransferase
MSFYTEKELRELGLKSLGSNVLISKKACLYGIDRISISDNSRVDDFVIISAGEGGVVIGRNVHIACFCSLIGQSKIVLNDYAGLSSRVSIYSSSDDYSGSFLTNPTIPSEYTNVDSRDVFIDKHSIVGAGSIVLPGVTLQEGVAVGALSLVLKSCEAWTIYSGTPARKIKARNKNCQVLESRYESKG